MLQYPNAKINLGLNVVAKLQNGYHEIESCFYPIFDCIDALELIPGKEGKLSTYGDHIDVPSQDNIVYKAYKKLQEKCSFPSQNIYLYKRIPSGGGLGGGSADAAFLLTMMKEKYNLDISEEDMLELGKSLGADVPFFLLNKACIAHGIGEKLTPIELDLSKYRIQLYFPDLKISTPWAFSQIKAQKPDISIEDILKKPVTQWKEDLKNDFEPIVFKEFPQLEKMKEYIYSQGALYASMSGTGSTMYGIFNK